MIQTIMTPIIMIQIITIDSQHSNEPLIDTDEAAGALISSFFAAEGSKIAEQEAQNLPRIARMDTDNCDQSV